MQIAPLNSGITTRDTQAWPRPVVAWSVVTLFCVAAILSYTDRQILSLLVDPIRDDLGISDTQIGVLQGVAFALIYSIAGLPLGRLADILPRRAVIWAGVGLWSIGTLLCGYAPSFWVLFAGRLIVGVGEAALAPAAMSMIADMFPAERRGLATGVFVMGMTIGGGVAIAIGGAVLGLAASGGFQGIPLLDGLAAWRAVLVLLGLAGLPLLLALLPIREPARRSEVSAGAAGGQEATALREIVAQLAAVRAVLIPVIVCCAFMSVGDFALIAWAPALLSRRYAMTPDAVGLALGSLVVAAGVVATVAGGVISDVAVKRYGPPGRIWVATVCAALAFPFALVSLTSSPSQVLAAVTLWTLFSSAAGTIGITAVQEIVPNRARGLTVSFISFGNILLGLGGGATLTGYVTDHVFADPLAIGQSLTLVIAPLAGAAALLFLHASRTARSVSR
ncbi:MFS transporter [Nitrospirillum pindoramense]|uniref:Sugar phosphate permease n=1 Tax=Nitrospirillum amazonense TaxID=28077 RepID=A0A560H4A9_9PROT|nr:MFS transporter [Nitrospirillum amazonense]TWB41145.1 sugar phosphate permease [Nitrospirillum amazonense]